MNLPLHHMDFIFQTKLGTYPLAAQCEMLAELGYQGLTVSAWSKELDALASVKPRWGLDVGAIYLIYGRGLEDFVTRIFETAEGCTRIELALDSGDGVTDADLRMIERLLPICERRGIDIALYPHGRYGMQTTTEAVALCQRFDHPALGIVFNGYHWYAMQEGSLDARLDALWPWLRQVNLAGCRMSPLGWGGLATIEPLDEGEMDNFVLLGALERRGFKGRCGVLGWESMGGDVYGNLQRSMTAFRSMEARLAAHPGWAVMTQLT
ncbi:sugar phosphate isomerase/epimerase family protein [Paracoccus denitrificans]|jgi:sugar phosphate isomerase/epimerase|uniref:Xylose isomerase domain protein TIM barrel n=1 Tax=Paracoccus denitrificans (strain Pd 1222) TaxID=318586 RepID=A1AYJ9_PARDP|nr:TIM barrel protein [Paracoccus denitrificans]ABL68343.1 Xylose isomerase domain protein TIM barrel [Paracoccus denitrificans PD1222]MBB4627859.1 sugar phosphate isomerase/epimerase [Paracoccus denitrificans]MCU7428606.1 sugar phosphate isomerase/epimerase [Paracoccus denitrificans]QAR26426.1 xylose isomerase [Paracoccus denitrificans]UPV95362.1 sugar phosphate isomerase/epimerase [Paracoccus denitrificans]